MTCAGQQTAAIASLARWHLEEAGRAELEAGNTGLPSRRLRLLSAARYHRDCAELAREELP
ncbi:hypothetical protein [Azospirillum oryzae]|uniref:hypothetical protein n=1 Tax=Azospirillum oryzae TaxID=286727 RepID=UPI000A15FB91|nr:hypothetical protein [Azospirillum oryzae]